MGQLTKPVPVKLIIGMLAKNNTLFISAKNLLLKEFGHIDYESQILAFNYTNYYTKEMGQSLQRQFISFKKFISPEKLAKIKLTTNSLEKKLSIKKGTTAYRQVNIDPGYISDSKLILATTKDYFHRIYLNNGIYAEVTLFWKKGAFQPFEWTYPDYRIKEYMDILNYMRNSYMKERAINAR